MSTDFSLRPATPADIDLVWACRRELAGSTALQSGGEDYETHRAWMTRAVEAPDRLFLIAVLEGQGAGYVRFDPRAPEPGWRTSLCLLARTRGRGLGALALERGCVLAEEQGKTPVFAEIHSGNQASQRVFRACGFVPDPSPSTTDFDRYIRAHPEGRPVA